MVVPYHLLPIGIGTAAVYLMCDFLVRLGVISQSLHRKIWNFILLFVFVGSAILGLLLAIQVNYKLGWTFVDAALRWHVELGIAMSVVAVVHIFWHLGYFSKPLRKTRTASKKTNKAFSGLQLSVMSAIAGVISVSFQILILRQVTKVFQGNEFTMTWVLGIWMVLTGLGAALGRKLGEQVDVIRELFRLTLLQSIVAILVVAVLGYTKAMFIPAGVLASPAVVLAILFFVLIPVCIPVGLSYALLLRGFTLLRLHFSKAYIWESLGSMLGGGLVSLVLIQFLDIYQSIALVILLVAVTLAVVFPSKYWYSIASVMAITGFAVFIYPVGNFFEKPLYPNQQIAEVAETPEGSITITRMADQYNFFENGSMIFATGNPITAEEGIHYTMLQAEKPESVLLISGGFSGMLSEILKYGSVSNVCYVELNSRIAGLASRYSHLPRDTRIRYIYGDGRRFLKSSNTVFDVIILGIPEPTSLQLNRFYSDEFLQVVRQHLKPGGYFSISLPSAGNYLSSGRKGAISSIASTLKGQFLNVDVVTGERDYLIASDSPVNIHIAELLRSKNMDDVNSYVNSGYLNDDYTDTRSNFFWQNVEAASINTDNSPRPVFLYSLSYLSQFGRHPPLFSLGAMLVLVVPFLLMKGPLRLMYVTGFSGATAEVLILLMFQIFFGYLYAGIGAIVALFMVGLALGSYFASVEVKSRINVSFLMPLFFLIIPALWWLNDTVGTALMLCVVAVLTVIPAFAVGHRYVVLCSANNSVSSASGIYSADLLGSALGVVLSTLVLIPLLGINLTALAVAGVNILVLLLQRRIS
ncbi:MAG: hypothetical protein AB7S54_06655 [Bacteroidales bacterium]